MASSVTDLRPSTKGHNLTVKVLEAEQVAQHRSRVPVAECLVGDETGTIILAVRNSEQVEKAKPGSYLTLTNAKVEMYRGTMRLAVDKWGSLETAEGASFQPKVDNNMSLIEFELVPFDTI